MPTKTAGKGLQRVTSRVRYSWTQINPAPGNTQQRGRGHAALFQRKLGVHVKIYSYMNRDSVF